MKHQGSASHSSQSSRVVLFFSAIVHHAANHCRACRGKRQNVALPSPTGFMIDASPSHGKHSKSKLSKETIG